MNKEHFLTELKIHLRPLYNEQLRAVLDTYEEKFQQGAAEGRTEQEISKELGSPVKIAQEILRELNLQPTYTHASQNHDWQEIYPENDYQDTAYTNYDRYHEELPRKQTSFFVRFCQVAGIFFFNIFFMIWMIFAALCCLFAFWLVDIIFLFMPVIGIIGFFVPLNPYPIFTLSVMLLFFALGLIGFVILRALTVYIFRFLKYYTQSNLRILRGR